MSQNINLAVEIFSLGRVSFGDFYQTTTEETEYVLSGCPKADPEEVWGTPCGEVSSFDPEWGGAIERLMEITRKRMERYPQHKASYEQYLLVIERFNNSRSAPGVQCFIYGM